MQWNARSIFLPNRDEMIVAPLCNISDKCYAHAAAAFSTSNISFESYCIHCTQQCSVTNFNIHQSMWKTPASWLINDIRKFVENTDIPLPIDWSTQWRSHIESSYLSIELIHESSTVENYTQTATLTTVDVLSNVGGQTGLWIGVSFLSLMELAEMIYRLIRYQFQLMRQRSKRTNDNCKV
jgi:hypothetical protein